MKLLISSALILMFTITACAQNNTGDRIQKDDLTTQDQKVSYAIGHDIGNNFHKQEMNILLKEFFQGIKDGMADTSLFTDEETHAIITQYQQEMTAQRNTKTKELGEKNQKEGEEYLAENGKKEGVITTDSGLQYKVLKKGDGPMPAATDTVTVHYKGYFINGKTFDSSYDRNEPATFPVLGVVPGWQEALQLMHVGDKFELAVPYNLAYGERGRAPLIEPYKTLLFEVELLGIKGK